MTAAQKAARVKFNKAIAIRKKTGCSLKEAFAQVYGKKVGAAPKKKATSKKVYVTILGQKVVKGSAAHKKLEYTKKHSSDLLKSEVSGIKKKKPASKKKKISEQAILNKIHKVKKSVDVLDEAQHKHMMGKKLGLVEQIGKIKMGSVFIYYKGFSIEKMDLTIKDKKKKLPIYIVHEFGNTYKTLAAAKAAINFLAR